MKKAINVQSTDNACFA